MNDRITNATYGKYRIGMSSTGVRFLVLGAVLMLIAACSTVQASAPTANPTNATADAIDFEVFLPEVTTPSTPSPLYLPLVSLQVPLSTRLGFGAARASIQQYPEIASLRAGWYLDWRTRVNPERPNGMEYAQAIRLHQTTVCPIRTSPDRVACPYSIPHAYTYSPSESSIQAIARANLGSLWLIGNEMDRRDWWGGGQDEILPELYAEAYHELYYIIKEADPTAKVAIGGVVQATPLRMAYLTRIWNRYQLLYGEPMPVDIWNVHTFIIREQAKGWGADIPPGFDDLSGEYIFDPLPDPEHISIELIDEQIRRFRTWMKERGQQQKPLIVTEYGVLYHNSMLGVPNEDDQTVIDFMTDSFDYFLRTADCEIGYAADDCRLVQRWLWFSLDFKEDFNIYGKMFDPDTKEIMKTGRAFRDYSLQNLTELSKKPY